MTEYPIILTPDENGYIVFIPDFNINTQGSSLDDAIYMASDALNLMVLDMREDGKTLPTPTPIDGVEIKENEQIILLPIK